MSENKIDDELLITLTAHIVIAHVTNNALRGEDLPALIRSVHGALERVSEAGQRRPKPAVPVRASVTKRYLVCLEDGKKMQMLKRHLMAEHGLTPSQYRARWGLRADYPMIAANFSEKRRDLAMKAGFGREPENAL